MWIIQEFEDAATMDWISNPQQNTQGIDMFSRLRGRQTGQLVHVLFLQYMKIYDECDWKVNLLKRRLYGKVREVDR